MSAMPISGTKLFRLKPAETNNSVGDRIVPEQVLALSEPRGQPCWVRFEDVKSRARVSSSATGKTFPFSTSKACKGLLILGNRYTAELEICALKQPKCLFNLASVKDPDGTPGSPRELGTRPGLLHLWFGDSGFPGCDLFAAPCRYLTESDIT